jgi:uncharacterized protein YjbI with pentapeptide repeats
MDCSIDLPAILASHAKSLAGEEGGERVNLSDANLSDADLSGANLTGANLIGAKLAGAKLAGAKLAGAELEGGANSTTPQEAQ